MKHTYFLAGPWQYEGAGNDYSVIADLISKSNGGSRVFTPLDITVDVYSEVSMAAMPEAEQNQLMLRAWVSHLGMQATAVVTLKDWESNSTVVKFVRVARELGYDIIPISKMLPV